MRGAGYQVEASRRDDRQLAEIAPSKVTLAADQYGGGSGQIERLLEGDWPKKRNIIVMTEAPTIESAKELLRKLRLSVLKCYS